MAEDKELEDVLIAKRPTNSNVDAVITQLGGFGCFQLIVIFMLAIMDFPLDASIYLMVFHTHKPSWKCTANSTQCLFNSTMPNDDDSRCTMRRSEWEYVTPTSFSISTDFDLICGKKWMATLMSSIIFVGWGVGAVVFGFLSDNYGRKRVNYISILMIIFVGTIASFLDSMPLIILCRLIVGFFVPGASVQTFVLVSEYTDTKYRPLGTFLIFALAIPNKLILLLKAYYIRNWRTLQLVCTAPYLVTLLSFFVVPESIRWLRVKGKQEELMKTLKRVAFWNRRQFSEDLMLEPISDDVVRHKFSPVDVFRTRPMAVMSSILGYTWFVNGMIYYAFFLSSGNLGGSLYVNFALMAVMGIPSEAFCGCLCRAIGRKKTTMLGMFLASVFCFSLAFLHGNSLTAVRISFALIGNLFIGISFSAIYTWSVEIYPTTTRANGMAFLQVTSRIGAASAPWVAKALLAVHRSAPYYVMSATAFIGFTLLFFLPETSKRPMRDVNESEDVEC